ncbi:hypothetical protein KQI49_05180 [Virgibacillus sp. MSJ-26]|uniref:hypothetical protein n=1 Tax=Virgibacillus sp. MSJ-26 TaxID=2841522 RepID=UPI001C128EC4|nr:hypothetical protein [Virgibacillus sp. MSJ-26]MBU5466224.1 hypothetical protein [Virgibacillus sp. MSJ-26]
MSITTLIIFIAMFVYFFKDKKDRITVYETNEQRVGESHNVFAMLKNNALKPKFSVPIDWKATLGFGRIKNNIEISVHKNYAEKARQLVMFYRADQRKAKRNIVNNKLNND